MGFGVDKPHPASPCRPSHPQHHLHVHPTASGSLAWDYGALHLFQHRPPHHYAPRQRRWRKAEKDPSYSIVYRGEVCVRKRSARHNTCCACCSKTRSTRSTCRTQTTHASRAERAERAARSSRGRLRSRLPARAKRVARVARHYCTRAHVWGAASSQFGYPAYAVVPQGSHWSHG